MTDLNFKELQEWLNKNNPKINIAESKYSDIYIRNGKTYIYDLDNEIFLEIYRNNNEIKTLKENAPYRIINKTNMAINSWNNNKKLFSESLAISEKLENEVLNPAIWTKDKKLITKVKEKIEELVKEFKEYLDDIDLNILDVQLVGSNAAYNYTDKSDIDVHIITNFEDYGEPEEIVSAAMNANKANFNKSYDVNYKGYNVELYVQDVKSGIASNGIYSVTEDRWIKEPEKLDVPDVDLEPDLSEYKKEAEELLKSENAEEISKFIDDLYMLRRNSLMVDGEFGKGNLIFKELRNEGLLDRLKEKRVEIRSKELSLENFEK